MANNSGIPNSSQLKSELGISGLSLTNGGYRIESRTFDPYTFRLSFDNCTAGRSFTLPDRNCMLTPCVINEETGDLANPVEGIMVVNTVDKNIKIYADSGWRQIATWA